MYAGSQIMDKLVTASRNGSAVRVSFADGETITGDQIWVEGEADRLVCRLLSSNRMQKYPSSDQRPGIVAKLSEVISVDDVG